MGKVRNCMKKLLCLTGILLCTCVFGSSLAVCAAQPQENTQPEEGNEPVAQLPLYEDGDVVAVIGDSITHAKYCDFGYAEMLDLYYQCRFPDRKTEFRNMGAEGYKARDVLNIINQDPCFRGFNKAIIMLGTNEAVLKYSPETYLGDMDALILALKDMGLDGEDILVITPPLCDEKFSVAPIHRFEDRVLEYIEGLKEKTEEWGTYYLDIHTPMVQLTAEIREENPSATLTTGDAIHPSLTGQLWIAAKILYAQGAEREAFGIEISKEFIHSEKGAAGGVRVCTMPLSVTGQASKFRAVFEQVEALYRDKLVVPGLSEDVSYRVLWDETELGCFTGRELADGVDYASFSVNPFAEWEEQLYTLNRQTHKNTVPYRSAWVEVMMQRASYTKEQAGEMHGNWKKRDDELCGQIEELLHEVINSSHRLIVVEEDYPVEQLLQDCETEAGKREEARKRAEAQAQERVKKEAKLRAERMSEELIRRESREQAGREAEERLQDILSEQAEEEAEGRGKEPEQGEAESRRMAVQVAIGVMIMLAAVLAGVICVRRKK